MSINLLYITRPRMYEKNSNTISKFKLSFLQSSQNLRLIWEINRPWFKQFNVEKINLTIDVAVTATYN